MKILADHKIDGPGSLESGSATGYRPEGVSSSHARQTSQCQLPAQSNLMFLVMYMSI